MYNYSLINIPDPVRLILYFTLLCMDRLNKYYIFTFYSCANRSVPKNVDQFIS